MLKLIFVFFIFIYSRVDPWPFEFRWEFSFDYSIDSSPNHHFHVGDYICCCCCCYCCCCCCRRCRCRCHCCVSMKRKNGVDFGWVCFVVLNLNRCRCMLFVSLGCFHCSIGIRMNLTRIVEDQSLDLMRFSKNFSIVLRCLLKCIYECYRLGHLSIGSGCLHSNEFRTPKVEVERLHTHDCR